MDLLRPMADITGPFKARVTYGTYITGPFFLALIAIIFVLTWFRSHNGPVLLFSCVLCVTARRFAELHSQSFRSLPVSLGGLPMAEVIGSIDSSLPLPLSTSVQALISDFVLLLIGHCWWVPYQRSIKIYFLLSFQPLLMVLGLLICS